MIETSYNSYTLIVMIRTSYETIKYIDLTKTVRDVVHHVTSLGRYVKEFL